MVASFFKKNDHVIRYWRKTPSVVSRKFSLYQQQTSWNYTVRAVNALISHIQGCGSVEHTFT